MISDAPTYTSMRHCGLTKSFGTLTNESVLHEVVMIGGVHEFRIGEGS